MGQAKAMETMDQIAAEVNRKEIITSNEPDVCVCVLVTCKQMMLSGWLVVSYFYLPTCCIYRGYAKMGLAHP